MIFKKAKEWGTHLKKHDLIAIRRTDHAKIEKFIIKDDCERRKQQKLNPDMFFFKTRGDLFNWYLSKYGKPYKKKEKRNISTL
jgi:hypothetical protein